MIQTRDRKRQTINGHSLIQQSLTLIKMATKKEKMKNALAALGEILMSPGHVGSFVIRKDDGLDESQIKLLLEIGTIREPVDGW